MKKFLAIIIAFVFLAAAPAWAEEPVVIELFTSQGCDMCPPAHILQKEYAEMAGAIILTWHVEHWDFMGWRDTYAKPEFSKRQYDYNEAFGRKGVYTPQVVINGREQVVGSKKLEVYTAIKNALVGNETPVNVRFGRNGNSVRAIVGGRKPATRTEIFLIWVKLKDRIKINSGTNIGKTLDYMNIVRSSTSIGTLNEERQTFTINLDDPNRGDSDALAILIQEGNVGRIIGAGFLVLGDRPN